MTFNELKAQAIKEYYPALFFELVYPLKIQHRLQVLAWLFTGGFLGLIIIFSTLSPFVPFFEQLIPIVYAMFFITLPLTMIVFALRSFYYSYYFKGLPDRGDTRPPPLMQFELAHILYTTNQDDLIIGFLKSKEGIKMMHRAGIKPDDIAVFVTNKKQVLSPEILLIQDQDFVSINDYVDALYNNDKEFADFLFAHSVQKKDMLAIVQWVTESEVEEKRKQRWWSQDHLGRISGVGKNWTYGSTFYLDEYGIALPQVRDAVLESHSIYGSKELEKLESVLSKDRGANAFLIGNDKEGLVQIIARLNYMIEEGLAFPEIEHKRVILFDADLLIGTVKTKADFEEKILGLLQEAEDAGNIILVFANFPSFLSNAQSLGSDAVSLLDRYFTSAGLHLVGLCDVDRFHESIERNGALMQRFEKIYIEEIDNLNTIRVLQNEIIPLERHHGIFFTYQSLVTIAESAERYFPEAVMPDRAIDLLIEIAPKIAAQGKALITQADVLELVKSKTGIPVGAVEGEERKKLINLEKILHQRIVGQDSAVDAIANAVRRARSGINNPNRPLASFLFLGPTGVGKTETTKALAEVFFGVEAKIERLDMSEYVGPDALSKLIGSYEAGKLGVLSTMLREHPYGVLLLDEFEKTSTEVMNLFLSILDEGFFSDMSGKKINARNMLIIATSNAGSDIIWEAIKHGDDLSHSKEIIIDSIIQAGIMKPELMNRFDGLIIFHPLASEHLEKIARLQLERLSKRLAERGIKLAITDDLVKYVMSYGTDPKFGARPMNRAIQDKVEQVIADKMIRGEFRQGSEIRLDTRDLGTPAS
ncbi:MAG: ATP-dependent Clp protease ATP-binding subunit [bacterium]|nr:ATP-dependent Clp protease ATP-binding subunit [bacterium]